jgi:hypothetical protein
VTTPPHDPHQPFAQGRSHVTPPVVPGGPPAAPHAWPEVAAPAKTGPLGSLRRLGPKRKAGVIVGGVLLASLLLCCGTSAVISAITGKPKEVSQETNQSPGVTGDAVVGPTAPSTVTTQPAAPKVESKTETQSQSIAFTEKTMNDPSLAKGVREVRTAGVNGVKTLTYEVTYTDAVETGRTLVNEAVTTQPVTQVTAVGTKVAAQPPAPKCDPNYSGCVPIASDVDCLGGGGNGPAYVKGPVNVIGVDIYKLDADNDGIACE